MNRMTIAFAVSALLVAGSVSAQTAPPPVQTPPPTGTAKPTPTPQATPTPTPTAKPTPKPTPPPEPFPTGATVAYIDLQRIVAESKLGIQGQNAMKALAEKLDGALLAKQKEVIALQDRIKTQQGVVSDSVIQNMGRELERMQREGQFLQQDRDVQVNQLNQELLTSFQAKVLPVVEDIRKEKGLLIIFALGDNSNIAAAHAGLDLSLDVIKRLDASIK
jgi:Skp family chaperone for outer membrane proteins